MQLIVGDVSTWSMRAWMCLRLADVPFSVVVIPLGTPGYKEKLATYSPSMLVPVLDTGELKVHDSLAIAEYANELSEDRLLPTDPLKRAMCRSLSSELHSGFATIRRLCPFSWEPTPLTEPAKCEIQVELARLEKIWSAADGLYYFGNPTIVDAFYSVLAYRLASYEIDLADSAGAYQQQLLAWPVFTEMLERARDWIQPGRAGA